MAYVSFDGLVKRFQGQIYQTRKGRLRMHLIDALYNQYLPLEQLRNIRVLDAAGGLGQMSHWFLAHEAIVDYFDISAEMVTSVSEVLSDYQQAGRFSASQQSIIDFQPQRLYPFVNVHAVLEWLDSPYETLQQILQWVEPGGYLGLMVYNRNMLMLRHLMRGTLARAMSGNIGGDKKGLTPVSPLDPLEVRQQLIASDFDILTQAGIRSFSDLAEKTVIDWYDEAEVFDAEYKLCEQRPFCDMARYVLFIARRL
ncbi:MAG: methyltransferase domain-containing protein [Reinekea sp.]